MSEALKRLADRAAADPFFLGHALTAFQARHRISDPALAAKLKVTLEQLAKIRLCRMPGIDERHTLTSDLRTIAERMGCDLTELARIVLD